jgi:hypothetical protein
MNTRFFRWLTAVCVAVMALIAATLTPGISRTAAPPEASDFSPYVTKEGGISLPANYRDKFMHMGSWAVAPKPNQPVHEIHNVYARAEDVRAYRSEGRFPDGAVLDKA